MPNIPPSEVQQLDVVEVDGLTIDLSSSGKKYKATYIYSEDQPLKEKDVLIITNRTATSVGAKRFINGRLDDLVYSLVFL